MTESFPGLTPEERLKLVKELSEELDKHKARELGTQKEDLVKKVVDGECRWVKKADILMEQEKIRQLAAKQRPLRALRGGEDSLAGKIDNELDMANQVLEELAKDKVINSMDKIDIDRSIQSVRKQAELHIKELTHIESNIERQKSRDPIFNQAEKVLTAMHQFKIQGKTADLNKLRQAHTDLIAKYEIRRKSLNPMLLSARNERSGMQRDFWKIMQISWDMILKQTNYIRPQLIQYGKTIPSKDIREQMANELKEFQTYWEALIQRHTTLSNSVPVQKTDVMETGKRFDEIIPQMETMLEEGLFLLQTIREIDAKYREHADSAPEAIPELDKTRMAFQDRRK